jgi:two-component system sensor histidine kinase KdpD
MGKNARWRGYIWAVGATVAGTGAGIAMSPRFDPANIAMVYLLAVLCVALRYGRGSAVLTALLSIAALDFLFVPPQGSFAMDDSQYFFTYTIMLVVALVIAGFVRRQAKAQAALGAEAGTERIRSVLLASIARDLRAPPPP